ncbi:MAG TPA: LLM class flavin-dependent oxidoreductase [Pedobacter sp.]
MRLTSLVNAAAAITQKIKLGTAVSVLSTDDPIRVYQQLAIAAAIAPGRIEAVAGRGSSGTTFQVFDHDEGDYVNPFSDCKIKPTNFPVGSTLPEANFTFKV